MRHPLTPEQRHEVLVGAARRFVSFFTTIIPAGHELTESGRVGDLLSGLYECVRGAVGATEEEAEAARDDAQQQAIAELREMLIDAGTREGMTREEIEADFERVQQVVREQHGPPMVN